MSGQQKIVVTDHMRQVVEFGIKSSRDESKSMGVHNLASGFNQFLRDNLKGVDIVAMQKQMEYERFVATRPAPKGYMIYLWDEAPEEVIAAVEKRRRPRRSADSSSS